MKFIPETSEQYKFNEKGEVYTMKQNRWLKTSTDYYTIIFNKGRRSLKIRQLKTLYEFLDIESYPIPNYSNYHITKSGDIYSITTNIWVKPHFDKDGYKRIALVNDDGVRLKERVCRLVAKTLLPNPNNYPIVNHKDEIKHNDNVNNIEWCTHSYNKIYSQSWVGRKRDKNGRFI